MLLKKRKIYTVVFFKRVLIMQFASNPPRTPPEFYFFSKMTFFTLTTPPRTPIFIDYMYFPNKVKHCIKLTIFNLGINQLYKGFCFLAR